MLPRRMWYRLSGLFLVWGVDGLIRFAGSFRHPDRIPLSALWQLHPAIRVLIIYLLLFLVLRSHLHVAIAVVLGSLANLGVGLAEFEAGAPARHSAQFRLVNGQRFSVGVGDFFFVGLVDFWSPIDLFLFLEVSSVNVFINPARHAAWCFIVILFVVRGL